MSRCRQVFLEGFHLWTFVFLSWQTFRDVVTAVSKPTEEMKPTKSLKVWSHFLFACTPQNCSQGLNLLWIVSGEGAGPDVFCFIRSPKGEAGRKQETCSVHENLPWTCSCEERQELKVFCCGLNVNASQNQKTCLIKQQQFWCISAEISAVALEYVSVLKSLLMFLSCSTQMLLHVYVNETEARPNKEMIMI